MLLPFCPEQLVTKIFTNSIKLDLRIFVAISWGPYKCRAKSKPTFEKLGLLSKAKLSITVAINESSSVFHYTGALAIYLKQQTPKLLSHRLTSL